MAGCKPNCCTQPRVAPWGNDVALIKVSRSVRAACFMRGNAPCGVKGINGLRAFGAWHFCAGAQMPNVSIAVYVSPGRCPGLWATFGLCIMSAALGIARTSSALRSLARHFSPPQSFTGRLCKLVALIAEPQPILCKDKHNKAMCRVFTLPAMFFVGRIRQSFPLWAQR